MLTLKYCDAAVFSASLSCLSVLGDCLIMGGSQGYLAVGVVGKSLCSFESHDRVLYCVPARESSAMSSTAIARDKTETDDKDKENEMDSKGRRKSKEKDREKEREKREIKEREKERERRKAGSCPSTSSSSSYPHSLDSTIMCIAVSQGMQMYAAADNKARLDCPFTH